MGRWWRLVKVKPVDGVARDVESAFVEEVVAADAEPDELVHISGTTHGPPLDVVDLQVRVMAPGGGADTCLPGQNGAALLQVRLILRGPDIQDLGLAVGTGFPHQERGELRDAQEVHQQVRPDRPVPSQRGRLHRRHRVRDPVRLLRRLLHPVGCGLQRVSVDEHRQVRLHALVRRGDRSPAPTTAGHPDPAPDAAHQCGCPPHHAAPRPSRGPSSASNP